MLDIGCSMPAAADDRGYNDWNSCKSDLPVWARLSSSRCVQLQSQHAQGSVPFSWRQLRRECASPATKGAIRDRLS